MILGIDFGTCYSSVAVMVGREPVTSYLETISELGMPSCFLYHDGQKYFGEDCDSSNLFDYRGDKIEKMKREIRASPGNMDLLYQSGDRKFILKNVVEDYLRYLITKVKMKVDNDNSFPEDRGIEAVTITAPVAIAKNSETASVYREFLQDAVHDLTGINRSYIHVFDEPSAAAVSYLYNGRQSINEKQTVLVFDLGGGTLDIALVEHDPISQDYTVVDLDGDLNLGGGDWDKVLSGIVRGKLGIEEFDDEFEEYDFGRKVVELKIKLSGKTKDGSASYPWRDREGRIKRVEVTRREFDDATEGLLDQAMDKLKKVINNYSRGIAGIDKILLVGGSSNMPQVRERIVSDLKDSMDERNIISWDPSKAIAKGAAIHAYMAYGTDYGVMERINLIVPHTYGIKIFESEVSDKLVVRNCIFKNTQFEGESCEVTLPNTITARKNKRRIRIEVYESDLDGCESNKRVEFTDDMVFNGFRMFVPVPDDYSAKTSPFRIKVTMSLSRDGILRVDARDSITGDTYLTKRSKV